MKFTVRKELLALFFISGMACTKHNDTNHAIFAGDWKLVSATGTLTNDFTFKRNDTTIKDTEAQTYNSTSVAGHQSFSGNSTSSDSMTVQAIYTQNMKEYFNGVLNSDTTITYPYGQTAVNVQSDFEIIGSDSIHFTGPGIPLIAGLLPIGGAEGAIFSISGKTLTLTTHILKIDSSAAAVQHHYQTGVTTFMRQ